MSDMFRVVRDDGMQVAFMAAVHGIRSFEGVRGRATIVELPGARIAVASLADIIRSKRATGRPRDLAVVDVLEKSLRKPNTKRQSPTRKERRRSGRTSCASGACSRRGPICSPPGPEARAVSVVRRGTRPRGLSQGVVVGRLFRAA